jgi:protein-disulfide isomerase
MPDVLATIDGSPVTRADLEERVGDRLGGMEAQYQGQRYQLIESTVEEIVSGRLMEDEAKKRGITARDLFAAEIQPNAQVSADDVSAWYKSNEARMGGRALQDVFPQIHKFLTEQKTVRAQKEFVQRLAKQRDVEYLLGPYRVNLDDEGFPSIGPKDAPVTLVEFSDFECPFCSQFVATLEEVKKKYGDQVRLVFRQFPLSIHANAPKAAEASLCAEDQDKFWPMHDLLFEEQSRLDVAALKEKAGRLGLDRTEFDNCLDSGKHAEQVQEDMRAGGMVGVTGTPALFVNGIPAPSGALPYEAVSAFVEDELRRLE